MTLECLTLTDNLRQYHLRIPVDKPLLAALNALPGIDHVEQLATSRHGLMVTKGRAFTWDEISRS